MTRRFILVGVMVLVLVTGCRRAVLNQEKTIELSGGETHFTMIEPIKQAQTIKVTGTADNPVSILIGVEKDKEAMSNEVTRRKYTDKTLAKQEKAKDIDLQANIPANETALILVQQDSTKKTSVKLKITNQ